MGLLSDDLKNLGYEPTERESPFDEDGQLWTKGYELVCDETGLVIDKDTERQSFQDENEESEKQRYRYQHSGKVKLMGGFTSSYDWGEADSGFQY